MKRDPKAVTGNQVTMYERRHRGKTGLDDMTEYLNLEVPEFRFSIRIRLKSDFDGY